MYYSQFAEDRYLHTWIIPELKEKLTKFVVEAGAYDGKLHSNSRFFIENGWEGLLVEPQKEMYDQLVVNSEPYKDKVKTCNRAIFYGEGNLYLKDHHVKEQVMITTENVGVETKYVTLEELIQCSYGENKQIGILSIDMEGYDTTAIKNIIDNGEIRPEIIIIEGNSMECRKSQMKILNDEYFITAIFVFNTIWIRNDLAKLIYQEKL